MAVLNGEAVTMQNGDKVWTPARRIPGKKHYGIWDSELQAFIHNTHPGGVQYATAEHFVNELCYLEKRAAPGFDQQVIAAARALLTTDYDIFAFNCEHFVNYVADGKRESPQLQSFIRGTALIGGIAWLASSLFGDGANEATANRPKYDPTVARLRDSKGRFVRA
jgi:hypothetical protein